MKKHIVMIILAAGIYFPVAAQNKTGKYKFSSVNNFAVAIGQDNQLAGGFQSVNGVKRGNWFVGAGAGIDFYLYRTIPVFVDVRREFGKNKNKFFVYADAGVNIDWLQDEFYLSSGWDPNLKNRYKSGIYTDAGAGFFAGSKKGHGFIVSLGHSVKTFRENRWHSAWQTPIPEKDIYKFSFSRIVLKVGWKF